MNVEEDEDVFISMFDGFWKAFPGKRTYRANGAFPVSAAANMAAFSGGGGSPRRLVPPVDVHCRTPRRVYTPV